jgi:branched-chain amino acid transport system ATP-binding protein
MRIPGSPYLLLVLATLFWPGNFVLGMAPLIILEIYSIIRNLNAEGVSILLVEQNAKLAMLNSHRTYVLEAGQITFSGQSQELLSDQRVLHAYLGA